jgi:hypothetical protein
LFILINIITQFLGFLLLLAGESVKKRSPPFFVKRQINTDASQAQHDKEGLRLLSDTKGVCGAKRQKGWIATFERPFASSGLRLAMTEENKHRCFASSA